MFAITFKDILYKVRLYIAKAMILIIYVKERYLGVGLSYFAKVLKKSMVRERQGNSYGIEEYNPFNIRPD
jgi:hypothetical protein